MEFRTSYSPSADMPSPTGEPVYKWEYVTPEGEVVEESRNVYEMIQSSKQQTNYKELIEKYGMDSESLRGCSDAIYGDTTQFGSSVDDFGRRISALYQDLEQAVAAAQQGKTADQTGVQSAQSAKSTPETATTGGKA